MTTKTFSVAIFITAILFWLNWLIVLFNVDPFKAGFLSLFYFYLSLFLALIGTIYLIGFWLRSKIFRNQPSFRRLRVAWRQAIWFSFLIVGSIFMYSRNLLTWWNIILFILILTILEFFFVSYKREI